MYVHTCYFEFVHVYMHAFVHCTCMHEEIHGSLWHVDYSVLHRAVRSIACELYVVQRSVSRVTLSHFCRPIYRNLDLYDCCAKD